MSLVRKDFVLREKRLVTHREQSIGLDQSTYSEVYSDFVFKISFLCDIMVCCKTGNQLRTMMRGVT